MSSRVIAFIFARGGSKGVPRKNIRCLGGKPLIAYSIETARACTGVARVIVSTDDNEIAQVARDFGAEVPFMRPPELASDTSPEWLSWQHAARTIWPEEAGRETDLFLSVPTTAPLRLPVDLERALDPLRSTDADFVVTVQAAAHNPYFNMLTIDENGYARRALSLDKPVARRQDAPVMYDITTVAYATRPAYVLRAQGMFDGKLKAVVVPSERALDIDTEYDLSLAEFLLSRRFESSTS
jgi:N-acylneuraminate cytidylyltransferase